MSAAENRTSDATSAGHPLDLAGEPGLARPSGVLWLPARKTLIAADLHLGKSDRFARQGGPLLPPYEGLETLSRLGAEIEALRPRTVISLGDAFDDPVSAREPDPALREALLRLMAGRRWIWILGNHDPAAPEFGGEARPELSLGALALRHEPAATAPAAGRVEVAAHLHPKARLTLKGRRLSRRCFLWDGARLILPALGAYTGGLDIADPAFERLMTGEATALLLSGGRIIALPRGA